MTTPGPSCWCLPAAAAGRGRTPSRSSTPTSRPARSRTAEDELRKEEDAWDTVTLSNLWPSIDSTHGSKAQILCQQPKRPCGLYKQATLLNKLAENIIYGARTLHPAMFYTLTPWVITWLTHWLVRDTVGKEEISLSSWCTVFKLLYEECHFKFHLYQWLLGSLCDFVMM